MSDHDKNVWFLIGYLTACGVIWLTGYGIPRLLDWLSEDAEVIFYPAPVENGANAKDAETVIKESVEHE